MEIPLNRILRQKEEILSFHFHHLIYCGLIHWVFLFFSQLSLYFLIHVFNFEPLKEVKVIFLIRN